MDLALVIIKITFVAIVIAIVVVGGAYVAITIINTLDEINKKLWKILIVLRPHEHEEETVDDKAYEDLVSYN